MFILDTIRQRLQRGCQTMAYPDGPAPPLPDRHGGALRVEAARCAEGCEACLPVCPTEAITRQASAPVALDLGRCLFCGECVRACPPGAITHTGDHRLAARRREDLVLGAVDQEQVRLAEALDERLRKLFGRSLRLRQVSAGGCNACEADVNVLNTIGWDLGRFGIQFVASPRHADGLLITGPVTRNMELALRKTYDATPAPRLVVAVGACGCSGGIFGRNYATCGSVDSIIPVDVYIPGCPPNPYALLHGILLAMGRASEPR